VFCTKCSANLRMHHHLVDERVPPMKNHSPIIHPSCSNCGAIITQNSVPLVEDFSALQLILISGTAGSGKSALGQYIASNHPFVFIDGDAVSKCVNFYAKQNHLSLPSQELYHDDTLSTVLITLSLGYSVVCGYVFSPNDISTYKQALENHRIKPVIRILVPNRETCAERDRTRNCWTAGSYWIDKWFDEQQAYKLTHPEWCLDTSSESLEATYQLHFLPLIQPTPNHSCQTVGDS